MILNPSRCLLGDVVSSLTKWLSWGHAQMPRPSPALPAGGAGEGLWLHPPTTPERRPLRARERVARSRPRDPWAARARPELPWRRGPEIPIPGLQRAPASSAQRAAAWSPSWCGRCGCGCRPRRWVGLAGPGGEEGGPSTAPSPPGSVLDPGRPRDPRCQPRTDRPRWQPPPLQFYWQVFPLLRERTASHLSLRVCNRTSVTAEIV